MEGSPKRWNMGLIDSIFFSHEANTIKAIPLAISEYPDRIIWSGSKNGCFSVRSAYHMEMERLAGSGGSGGASTSGQDTRGQWWRALWKLNCPNKVKVFIWRFCKNALPTRPALRNRKLNVPPDCPLCGEVEESSLHVIWKCKSARQSWKDLFHDHWKEFKAGLNHCSNNLQLAGITLDIDTSIDLGTLWTTAWMLWNLRNSLVMQGVTPATTSIVPKVRDWLEKWRQVNVEVNELRHSQPKAKWAPPGSDAYKVNFDGALSTVVNKGGTGAVIRSDKGEFMAASSFCLDGAVNSDHVEAVAALVAMDVALSIGLRNIVLEGDSLTVINRGEEDLSCMGNIIRDIQCKALCFEAFSATHVRREANVAAHRTARLAISNSEFTVWMEDPPPFLLDVLLQDNLSFHQ